MKGKGFWVRFWMESGRGHSTINETFIFIKYEDGFTKEDKNIFEENAYNWAGHDMGGFDMMRFISGYEFVERPPIKWLSKELKNIIEKQQELIEQKKLIEYEIGIK